MFRITAINIVVSALLVSSCALNNSQKNAQIAAKESIQVPAQWTSQTEDEFGKKVDWLELFNDSKLVQLVKEGVENNHDLRISAYKMEKAWLAAEKAGASLKPSMDLSFARTESGRLEGGDQTKGVEASLKASWELDVWGRIQAGVSSSVANADAEKADHLFAKYSLSANIAKSYFKVVESQLQADIAQENLKILSKTMRITQAKYENGLLSGGDITLNRANLALAKDKFEALKSASRDALRALDILLGRYPNTSTDVASTLPIAPKLPPVGLPSEILERRPDIVSAERRVASAFNKTFEAKVARLPKFSLTGVMSGASSGLSGILNPANIAWQLGSNLLVTIVDGGRNTIDIKVATIEQKQAIEVYAKTALVAFSEVEKNLDLGVVLRNRIQYLESAVKQSHVSHKIMKLRYKEGEVDLLSLLTIQEQKLASQSNLLALKRGQLDQRINLYLALGGHW